MKKRIASWLLWRAERWLWVPRRLVCWAFDYAFEHGEPVELDVRLAPRVQVTSTRPLFEVNPPQRTWASSVNFNFKETP